MAASRETAAPFDGFLDHHDPLAIDMQAETAERYFFRYRRAPRPLCAINRRLWRLNRLQPRLRVVDTRAGSFVGVVDRAPFRTSAGARRVLVGALAAVDRRAARNGQHAPRARRKPFAVDAEVLDRLDGIVAACLALLSAWAAEHRVGGSARVEQRRAPDRHPGASAGPRR